MQRIIENPLATVADYYASCLPENKLAVEFVADELQQSEQQATEQRFGFADRTLGKHIPPRQIKAGRQLRDLLVKLGLYKANGRETLRGRVTEPITDNEGNVIGIRGYKVDAHGSGEAVIVVGQLEAGSEERKEVRSEEKGAGSETAKAAEATAHNQDDGLTIEDGQITFVRDDRRYRIRGLEKNGSTLTLKVNLMASPS